MNLDPAQQEIVNTQQQFWTALQNKDAQLFERIIAADFISRSPGQPNESREGFVKTLTSFPGTVNSIGSDNLEVHLFGDIGVLTGVQVAQLRLNNGAEIVYKIAFTNIFKRNSERWMLVFTHAVQLPEKS